MSKRLCSDGQGTNDIDHSVRPRRRLTGSRKQICAKVGRAVRVKAVGKIGRADIAKADMRHFVGDLARMEASPMFVKEFMGQIGRWRSRQLLKPLGHQMVRRQGAAHFGKGQFNPVVEGPFAAPEGVIELPANGQHRGKARQRIVADVHHAIGLEAPGSDDPNLPPSFIADPTPDAVGGNHVDRRQVPRVRVSNVEQINEAFAKPAISAISDAQATCAGRGHRSR